MESLDHKFLRQKAFKVDGDMQQPSDEDMQKWVTDSHRRRSFQLPVFLEASAQLQATFRELEQRYELQDVWGHNTTPAMQTLECIQKVKQALVEGVTDDSISSSTFSMLVGVTVMTAVAIVLFWELYFRPRSNALPVF